MRNEKTSLLWLVPLSSRIEKFQSIYDKQIEKYGNCLTIVMGEYDLYLGSGTISISDLEIKERLKVDATSGTVKLDNLTCKKDVEVEISSGFIDLDELAVEKGISASGKVIVSLTDSMNNYKITSGHCNLPDDFGNGDKYIDVDVSSGNVNFSFKE